MSSIILDSIQTPYYELMPSYAHPKMDLKIDNIAYKSIVHFYYVCKFNKTNTRNYEYAEYIYDAPLASTASALGCRYIDTWQNPDTIIRDKTLREIIDSYGDIKQVSNWNTQSYKYDILYRANREKFERNDYLWRILDSTNDKKLLLPRFQVFANTLEDVRDDLRILKQEIEHNKEIYDD